MKPIDVAGHRVNPLILLAGGGALAFFVLLKRSQSGKVAVGQAPGGYAPVTTDPTGLNGSDLVNALMGQVASDQGNVSALSSQLQGLQTSVMQLQNGTQPAPAPAPVPSTPSDLVTITDAAGTPIPLFGGDNKIAAYLPSGSVVAQSGTPQYGGGLPISYLGQTYYVDLVDPGAIVSPDSLPSSSSSPSTSTLTGGTSATSAPRGIATL